ncbi:MAG TPA: pyridoxamine 5'-phosphate oxidase family protein [Thermodesulfovibrionales bacterium]|nr:pyridoxamine 5'-phosphate oxidase family protein [Thermodesulfovibrionales bacterium]
MRRSNKEIKDQSVIIGLLNTCPVGRLGTIGEDGYPMVKPLNFVYAGGKIYFHTAREGEKMEHIARNNRVCFEADLPIAFVRAKDDPCRSGYLYRSVIIMGRAQVVQDRDEQIFGLQCLMRKYQPEGGYGDFSEEKLKITGVVRIDIEEMTGKEDLGSGSVKEKVEKAPAGPALPVDLE